MKRLLVLALVAVSLFPVHASFWGSEAVSTVEASGNADVKVAATVAEAVVTATSEEKTPDLASNALAKQTQILLTFLKAAGKAREVTTEAVNVSPRYDFANGSQKLAGYQGRVDVRFKADIGNVGALIAEALHNGASESGGYNPSINDADLQTARKQAIDLAVKDALWKARAALDAAGLKEKGIRKITVSAQQQNAVRMMDKAMTAMATAPIPVEGGTREVAANATVVLEFTRK